MKRQATPTYNYEQRLAQARRRVQLSKAIETLGQRWRGLSRCTHRYVNSKGVEVREIWPEREA